MAQKTNLNVSPYNDDFDKSKNYYRVLFNPGKPVQTRELITLQSILQNQIESFGSHMFKEGSMVIPGGVTYDSDYFAVQLNPDHLGLDVSVYVNNFVGKKIQGQSSNITAIVDGYELPGDINNLDNLTLYVKYLNSNSSNEISQFEDGELLISLEDVSYGNTTITSGSSFASLISFNATSIGAAVGISDGVYFIRGTFVDVNDDKLVLDPFTNLVSYRVGLAIIEEIVKSEDDSSLYDNAKGFKNYAAPGADRLKIYTKLDKKLLTDYDDKNFIELIRIENGEVKKLQNKSEYSIVKDYFAKRTFEESGDYVVDKFTVEVANSLNDLIGSNGVYLSNQTTEQGNTPSDNLMCVKVSPGKAYVRGYDIEKVGTTLIDVEKPRDVQEVSATAVPFQMGNVIKVNNVQGTPLIGIDKDDNVVDLYSTRGANTNLVGKARVYSFNLSDDTYRNQASVWELSLFDIQTYTELTLNTALNSTQCPATSYIKGVSSGAYGYVITDASSSTILLTQVSGTFLSGEQISINESTNVVRSVAKVKQYTFEDVKRVYQSTVVSGLSTNFIADTFLYKYLPKNFSATDQLLISPAGIATCPGKNFIGIRSDAIIRYQGSQNLEIFNRVESVSSDGLTMKLVTIPGVPGVCSSIIPSSGIIQNFTVGSPKILNPEKSYLYSNLPEKNISAVSLANSDINIVVQVTNRTHSSGESTINIVDTGIPDTFFTAFDAERYSVISNTGAVEPLTSDMFQLNNDSSQLTLRNLTVSSPFTLVATLRKINLKNKNKVRLRSEKLIVSKTSKTEAGRGLTTNNFYGLRLEDREISLNVPDAIKIVGIFESLTESDPTLDELVFVSGLNLDTNSIIGETVTGQSSGTVAQIVERSSTAIKICYLNTNKFVAGEVVKFAESNIETNLLEYNVGEYLDITKNYSLDKGQRSQFYDFSRIVRTNDSYIPSRRILVVFDYFGIPTNDQGVLYTVNSYPSSSYGKYIPQVDESNASDILDFRPRVKKFTSITSSPFAFQNRDFGTAGVNSTLVVAPNESSIIGYSNYLPRIDKVVLDKLGNISVVRGVSSKNPKPPTNVEEAMDLATITLPAYLYSPSDANISLVDNKRYTMRDISKLEDRISNIEEVTSLSLLEIDTKALQIEDANRLNRFKSGFFVDDFRNTNLMNTSDNDNKVDINENSELVCPKEIYSLKPQLALNSSINPDTADYSSNLSLLDSNVRKTGDLVTLNYNEKSWIKQPLATRVTNVNPFNIIEWDGNIILNPASDNWVRTIVVSGGTRNLTGDSERTYVENVKISSEADSHIRSRNVLFNATSLKPLTRYYPFFDNVSNVDIIPKLLEISMLSGTFKSGETVDGYINGQRVIRFRTCKPNHKSGNILSPSFTYSLNPYDRNFTIPSEYGASSTIINIDTNSLAEEVNGRFFGYVSLGVFLVGLESNAQATVTDTKLVTDVYGDVQGSFFIRNPFTSPPPPIRFTLGTKTFKLSSSSTNQANTPGSLSISSAETTYSASGIVDTYTSTNVVVRRPPPPVIPPRQNQNDDERRRRARRVDPVAQSFTVDENGAYLTSLDIFFASKDATEKLTVEIRTVELGTPTNLLIQDFARVQLEPSQINVSSDASIVTRVTFPSPIYLPPNNEYAVVLLAPSTNNYEVWCARSGERTVNTQNLPDAESVIYSKQYLGGSLFKSQNGTIWTPSQYEDLTFVLYKAQFTSTSGTVYFYNPPLRADEGILTDLVTNPIKVYPRKGIVGINTTSSSVFSTGRKLKTNVSGTDVFGYVERTGGPIPSSTSLTMFNSGEGYTSTGSPFSNVPLYSITGNGSGAQATVTTSNGKVTNVVISKAGNGYSNGDILGITTSSVGNVGKNATVTVSGVVQLDTIFATSLTGDSFGNLEEVFYLDGASYVTSSVNTRSETVALSDLYEGNIIEVTHYNHGMQSDTNTVEIKGVEPNTPHTILAQELSINANTILVQDAAAGGFSTFEGLANSIGFLKINNEIIYYDSINSNTINIGTLTGVLGRGVDGSVKRTHPAGSIVQKYELSGVSLRRINSVHTLPSDTFLKSLRGIDNYHLKITRNDRTGATLLNFTEERSLGGENVSASRNVQYDTVTPQFNILTPGETTTIRSQIRSVTGTSAGGNETSFVDVGFESVQLNNSNKLSSTRIVCSERNELARLTALPSKKSFTLGLTLSSADSNLSPVIDLQNGTVIFERSRLNNPIKDYTKDGRVNSATNDPHAAIYITNKVALQQPATSLKVLMSAYRHSSADFRVLYKLYKADSSEVEPSYVLFPGYDNMNDTDGDGFGDTIINYSNNSGRPDARVPSSLENQFLDYQFTADNLEPFVGFVIKVVFSGTNEAYSPRFKDFRTIALA
jgi:hypothetical protein